jgi:hypothetical protein
MRMIVTLLALTKSVAAVSCVGASSALPATECLAWQDFFDAQPALKSDPTSNGYCYADLRTDPCKSKSCVQCSGGHLTYITMYGGIGYTPLQGTLPESIGLLSNLEYFELYSDLLHGPMPASIANLTKLKAFDLKNNVLTGILAGLHYGKMSFDCNLRGNVFDCPLPAGAAESCGAKCANPPGPAPPGPAPPSKCKDDWTDNMGPPGFDCQLYEGAGWCAADGKVGPGWCQSSKFLQSTNKSCLATVDYAFGWGTLSAFTKALQPTAAQACKGCGADCPENTKKRTPNALPAGCADYSASDGRPWRDSWGYTCDAYRYGNFCVKNAKGKWVAGGLWSKADYGPLLSEYAWWAKVGSSKKKLAATSACCVCGGGKQSAL